MRESDKPVKIIMGRKPQIIPIILKKKFLDKAVNFVYIKKIWEEKLKLFSSKIIPISEKKFSSSRWVN